MKPLHEMKPLHVEQRSGRAPALVCLHGWGMNRAIFEPVFDALPGQECWAIDLPGHGASEWLNGDENVAQQLARVAAVLPTQCVLMGWSLGAMFALKLAELRPQQIAGLVLVAASPRFLQSEDWPQGMAVEAMDLFREGLAQPWPRTLEDFLSLQLRGSRMAENLQANLAAQLSAAGDPDAKALRADLEILTHWDLRSALPRIRQSTLVIAGQHDRVTSTQASRWLAEQMPSARYVEMPRGGHLPFITDTPAFASELQRFLTALPESEVATSLYQLPAAIVARQFDRAGAQYEAAANLQSEVRTDLLNRAFELAPAIASATSTATPKRILDLGCGTGNAAAELKRRWRSSEVSAVDSAAGMVREAKKKSGFWRPLSVVEARADALPFADGEFDLVFSNLMLQWAEPLDGVLAEVRRVLAPGGLFIASSFGPSTLQELRQAWAAADTAVHVNRFVDVHDLGSALARAGFVEPVLDVDRLLRWHPDVKALTTELKTIGAVNANAGRSRGLTSPGTWRRVVQAYEQRRQPKGLPATWEVVYFSAWAPAESARGRDKNSGEWAQKVGDELRFPVDQLRRKPNIKP